MDIEQEQNKSIWAFRFAIGLLITTFFAWTELAYAAFGTTVDATVGKTEIVESSRRGRDRSYKVVNYAFTDRSGAQRAGYDRVDDTFSAAPGSTVAVTYRGDASRLAGVRWLPIVFWLVFFLPTAWFVGGMIKESADYSREKKARAAKAKKPYRF